MASSISRYISLILRHKPEVIGITLDEHGWANVGALIAGVNRTKPLDVAGLEEIVRTDRLHWEDGKSYRIPGRTYPKQRLAVFDLTAAEQIQQLPNHKVQLLQRCD